MEAQDSSRYEGLRGLDKTAFLGVDPIKNDAARNLANKKLWQFILMGLGIGIGGRGALGAMRLGTKDDTPAQPNYQQVDLLVPPDEQQEKLSSFTPEWLENLSGKLFASGAWKNPLMRNFFGSTAESLYEVPALWALGLPAAAAAGYGGYKGTDVVFDKLRQSEQSSELDAAREQYTRLVEETLGKQASVETIEEELDDLADMCLAPPEKRAANVYTPLNYAQGLLATWAVLSAMASGKISYDYFKQRGDVSTSAAALEQRRKERTGGTPPVFLAPTQESVV